ncbi:DUF5610 domain-containing protein [Zoogloea sp.]|uniref:DUF5610 domain-containing protein n=1 Tax=Zoogloea sp. TaxID=49181 RepID=UPI001416CA3E|nr:MAG: hypothetical protein F9K15_15775 [Zoogloea sp.]
MAIDALSNSLAAYTQSTGSTAKAQETPALTAAGVEKAVRQNTASQILQASAEVSIKAGDESQTLLFKSAISRINELLAPEFGDNALQAAAANQDNSPQATADRILSLSTGFYSAYSAQHQGEDQTQVLNNFVDVIRSGFEQGFNEAKDILKGLKVLDGDIASGIQNTWDLVQKGYDDFLNKQLSSIKTETEPAAKPAQSA